MKTIKYICLLIMTVIVMSGCIRNEKTTTQQDASTDQNITEKEQQSENQSKESTEQEKSEESSEVEEEEKVYSINITIPSPSIGENLLEEGLEQPASIVLPPSYFEEPDKKYPVVYYLHGFGEYHSEGLRFLPVSKSMGTDDLTEFIIVGVNGRNSLGGSFYVNSPVIGNWEDYVIKDVIPYIEESYRVLSQRESRGIAGFSMGGFSAINLAFKYPDVFSSVFSISPGLFAEDGLTKAFPGWRTTFLKAYGAAFSPDINGESPYGEIPSKDHGESDQRIMQNWENGFGNLTDKITGYLSKEDRLEAIQIDYGSGDRYSWIPDGCQYFSELLDANDIEHTLFEFDGGHSNGGSINLRVIPFFSKYLKTDE